MCQFGPYIKTRSFTKFVFKESLKFYSKVVQFCTKNVTDVLNFVTEMYLFVNCKKLIFFVCLFEYRPVCLNFVLMTKYSIDNTGDSL